MHASQRHFTIAGAPLTISGALFTIAQIPDAQEDYYDVDDPAEWTVALKSIQPCPDVFSFWQRLPETEPKYPYHMEGDNVAAIRVRSYEEWLKQSVHPSVRTKLRKAERRGVSVREAAFDDALIRGIREIFSETPIRQGRPFAHYGRTPEEIRAEWSADLEKSVFFGAYFEAELIGFVKLSFTSRYAEMSGTLCKLRHRNKSPMNSLIASSVRFCEAKAIPYLTYGKFVYGRKGEDSLSDFKRYNGFQKVQLPRYYVALTLRGQFALRWKLYRSLGDYLSSWLWQGLFELRTLYYLRQFRANV